MPVSLSLTVPGTIGLHRHSAGSFHVTNNGSVAVVVTDTVADLNARSQHYPGAQFISISPAVFVLRPGQSRSIHISADMPARVHGDHFGNVEFTARPLRHSPGAVHVHAAVASSVRISAPGKAIRVTGPLAHGLVIGGHTTQPASSGGVPVALEAGGGGGVLLAVAAVWVLVVRRRRAKRAAGLAAFRRAQEAEDRQPVSW